MLDVPVAKVVFLDEFRLDPQVLSWATLCVWFDGSPVPLGRPQKVPGWNSNLLYKGTAPIFVTTKLADLEWLESHARVNPSTGAPWDADASMICWRLKVFRFTQRVAKPPKNIRFCACCFAKLLMSHAAAWCP